MSLVATVAFHISGLFKVQMLCGAIRSLDSFHLIFSWAQGLHSHTEECVMVLCVHNGNDLTVFIFVETQHAVKQWNLCAPLPTPLLLKGYLSSPQSCTFTSWFRKVLKIFTELVNDYLNKRGLKCFVSKTYTAEKQPPPPVLTVVTFE